MRLRARGGVVRVSGSRAAKQGSEAPTRDTGPDPVRAESDPGLAKPYPVSASD
jgi:hypothetical protein